MYEIKIRTNKRLADRIKMLAKENDMSINKMAIYLLELGVYQLLEEESIYGKVEYKKINSK